MNRRSLFRLIPAAPVVGVAAVAGATTEKKKLNVRLPRKYEEDWGDTLNNAILEIQEELNKRG